MKKMMMSAALTAICAAAVCAADFAPVKTSVKHVYVYQPEKYSLAQGASISNQLSSANATLKLTKSNGTKAPEAIFTYDAGNMGFCGLVNFCKFTVNGIQFRNTSPAAEDFTEWKEGDKAGCELKMNFDGAKIIFRLYKRPDSPVTWCKVYPAKDSVEPIKSVNLDFACIPSALPKDANKRVIFDNSKGVYNRCVVTATREIPQSKAKTALTAEDKYLIFEDKNFDGSAEDKGMGPCMLILPDFAAVSKAVLRVPDSWITPVVIDLKPDFQSFEFGLWQQRPRISNKDFAEKLNAEKDAFTLK